MLVEGAVVDADGARAAYVRLDGSRVVEVGQPGTASSRGDERRVRGIVVPAPVNGHVHLGDAVSRVEPPGEPVARLVADPAGYKFRLLRDSPPRLKVRAMRDALRRMERERVAATIDFREEGRPGVELLRTASRGIGVRVVALGRPLRRPVEREELASLLSVADGVGLSSAREDGPDARRAVAEACRAAGKRYALHASETEREPPETFLDPRPDLLVHLTHATEADLEAVRASGASVAVCPRSNALFGRQPNLAAMERLDVSVLLGTDNVMLQAPSIWRELEFAYAATRLRGAGVSASFLVRAAFVNPWSWLGEPGSARIAPGTSARPVVLRLPADDPAYQIVTRATEHVIVRPPPARSGGSA